MSPLYMYELLSESIPMKGSEACNDLFMNSNLMILCLIFESNAIGLDYLNVFSYLPPLP